MMKNQVFKACKFFFMLPFCLACWQRGANPFFVAGGGGMPSRHTFFPTLCITFLFFLHRPIQHILDSNFHIFPPPLHYFSTPHTLISNTSFHVPHEQPSPHTSPPSQPSSSVPLKTTGTTHQTHHQITSPFYLPHPIHPSNSIFSEIILPDALLENFLNYYFRELLFHYQDSFRSIYT